MATPKVGQPPNLLIIHLLHDLCNPTLDEDHHYEEVVHLGFDEDWCDHEFLHDLAMLPINILHRFLSAGSFSPLEAMSLVVALQTKL
jgi:hypothetical protein